MSTQPVILIIDDMPSIRDMLSMALNMWGYRVLTASNALDALSLVMNEKPHIIILDIMMSPMNGEEFIAHLSADERLIPIVVITALTDAATRERLWSLGVKQIVTKPFRLAALQDNLLSIKAAVQCLL